MFDRVSINPNICHGKPCVKGTRIMVSIILALVEEDLSFAEIKEEYPELTDEDIRQAIRYARFSIDNEEIRLLDTVS